MKKPPVAWALALGLVMVPAASVSAADLLGTWHVLVHYKDASTPHPERERWQDRVWVISMEGSRLKWVDYPIVVFRDKTGRFDTSLGRPSRVLAFWEPNAGQQEEISEGLEINPRGSRTKTLRGSPEKGWSSAKKSTAYQSARFITYTETWSIDDPDGLPVFTFDDVMGSASTDTFEGRTRYTAESVEGDVIRGSFQRDGTRTGTFQLTRAAKTSVVKGSGKSQGERLMDDFRAQLGMGGFGAQLSNEEALRGKIDDGSFSAADRKDLHEVFEGDLERWVEGMGGNDARALRPDILKLADKMTALFVDDGKSMEEILAMLRTGELRP